MCERGTGPISASGTAIADESYQLLRRDPKHPSLHFKKVGRFCQEGWAVLVRSGGLHHRALAVEHENTVVWFWIGPHTLYNRLVGTG